MMGSTSKVRSKVSVGSKKKVRWAKGHSSDCNPATQKFRTAARGFRVLPSQSAVPRGREASCCSASDAHLDCNSDGASEKSGGTFLSNFTCTTLPSFQKIFGMWKTGSLLHKDILAVLGAVTEVIRSQDGSETEAEYFAALLFTLNSLPEDNEDIIVATVYLINLICRHVAPNLLKAKFSTALEILYSVLCKCADSSNHLLQRYLLDTLGFLLSVQDVTVWTQPMSRKVVDAMLTFTVSPNLSVRRSALKSFSLILNESQSIYVADACANFACRQMNQTAGGHKKDSTATLLVFEFLRGINQFLPAQQLKNVFESLFKLLAVHQTTTVSTAVLGVFLRFFQERPSIEKLPAELNCQLILALYDFAPSASNAECVATWIFILTEAHKCLLDRSLSLCVKQIHRCFETLVKYLLNSNDLIATAAANNIQTIISETVVNLAQRLSESESTLLVLQKCLQTIEDAIKPQNFSRLQVLFKITSKFVAALGPAVSSLPNVQSTVTLIAELRDTDGFQLTPEADDVLGSFVRELGPETFLTMVPLKINCDPPCPSLDVSRSWLLPLLRDHIRRTRLQYFVEYFLLLATRVKRSVDYFKAHQMVKEDNIYSAVHLQIWSLLPSFCRSSTDLSGGLKAVGQIMGVALLERPELRLTVLSALRCLVADCLYQPEKIREMARYSKNFMPILFNLYTTSSQTDHASGCDDRGVRLAVLETIRALLKITQSELLGQYLDVAMSKCNNDATVAQEKNLLLDLCVTLVKYLDPDQICRLFDQVAPNFNNGSFPSLQKKAFRVVEEICCSETDGCVRHVAQHLDSLKQLLVGDLAVASPSAKACRLQAILGLLKALGDNDVEFVVSTIPVVALCLKENSSKTRKRAAIALIAIVEFLKDHAGGVNSAVLTVMNQLDDCAESDSFQGTSACLMAYRLLLYRYRNEVDSNTLSRMFRTAMEKLADDQRPVVQSALEFLSTAVGCCSDVTIKMYLEEILAALFQQNKDCQNHFRFLTRKVLIKVTKKFGSEPLLRFVPEQFHKQLVYVKKFCQRQEHKKLSKKNAEGNDSDEDDHLSVITKGTAFTVKSGRSRGDTVADLLRDSSDEDEDEKVDERPKKAARGKSSLWLKDDDEEDIVDLLDRAKLAQKIDSVDPKLMAARVERDQRSKAGGFKVSKDGKIIIGDLADELVEPEEKGDESDDESIMDCAKRGGKKRLAKATDDVYQPGGSGLHRKLYDKQPGGRKRKGETDGPINKKARQSGKADSFQPFSYVPMEFEALNRRKRAKFQGRFNNLVRGARKGANKGKKQQRK